MIVGLLIFLREVQFATQTMQSGIRLLADED